jgi:hypothetical protein
MSEPGSGTALPLWVRKTPEFELKLSPAGLALGRLGNSGDAFGPHLHYQLQSGPQLFHDQGLPFKFQNIDVPQLSRGRVFEAK